MCCGVFPENIPEYSLFSRIFLVYYKDFIENTEGRGVVS